MNDTEKIDLSGFRMEIKTNFFYKYLQRFQSKPLEIRPFLSVYNNQVLTENSILLFLLKIVPNYTVQYSMYIIWNVEFNTIFFEKMCLLSPLNAKYKVKDMPVCILPTVPV